MSDAKPPAGLRPTPPPPPPAPAPRRKESLELLWGTSIRLNVAPTATIRSEGAPARTETAPPPTRTFAIPGQAGLPDADYTIVQQLGEGGMGVVYTAVQRSLGRNVAVKTIKPEAARATSARSRFLAEALTTGDLQHPNIIPIHELGTNSAGLLFYTMKQVKGTPWLEEMAALSLADNLDILLRVADAVAFAHSRGVVHCDLKPANVMLGEFGEVLVMDWGLAVTREDLAAGAELGGTPAYMPPELAVGDHARTGPATDVYLLGAMLYEIIAGHPPHHRARLVEALQAAAENAIEPLRREERLGRIAMKAMASAPEDRYGGVAEFQKALREWRSHTDSFNLAANAFGLLLDARASGDYAHYSAAVHVFQQALELWPENDEASGGLARARREYAECAAQREDLELAESLLAEAGESGEALRASIRQRRRERDQRRRTVHRLRTAAGVLAVVVVALLATAQWWLDQQRRAAEEEALLRGLQLAAGRLMAGDLEGARQALPDKATGWEADWVRAETRQQAVPSATPAPPVQLERQQRGIRARVAGGFLEIRRGGNEVRVEVGPQIEDLAISSDDPPAVLVWEGRALRRFDAGTGAEAAPRRLPGLPEGRGVLSPDGRSLLWLAAAGEVRIWDTVRGLPGAVLEVPAGARVVDAAYSPDGAAIALVANPPGHVQLHGAGGGAPWRVSGQHPGRAEDPLRRVAYLPDGAGLVAGSFERGLAVMDPRTLTPRLTLPAASPPRAWAVSADGRLLAMGCADGSVRVLDLHTGKPGYRGRVTEQAVAALWFDLEGGTLHLADESGQCFEARLASAHPWQTLSAAPFPTLSLTMLPGQPGFFALDQQGRLLHHPAGGAPAVLRSGVHPRVAPVPVLWQGRPQLVMATPEGAAAWDVAAGAPGPELALARIQALAASPDGRLAALIHPGGVVFWDGQGEVRRVEMDLGAVRYAAWLGSSGLLALSGGPQGILLLDTASGAVRERLLAGQSVRRLLAHPTLPLLAAVREDASIAWWDWRRGKMVRETPAADYPVLQTLFSPDGGRLFLGRGDGVVQVLDAATGRERIAFTAHSGAVVGLALSPDGRRLLTSSTDGEVRAWVAE